MFWLIFFRIVTLLMLVFTGIVLAGFLYAPEYIRGSSRWLDILLVAIYAVSLILTGRMFCVTLPEHFASHIGYSTSEYRIEKKIVSPGKACANEADTVYFFVKIK